MAQSKTDNVVSASFGLSKREMCVAAMALLDQAGISVEVQGRVANLLVDEIDDFDTCELPGESYEECCARVEREEKRLDDEMHLRVEV